MSDHRTALSLAEGSQWGLLYQMIAKYPERAEECDDFGMMPLHWACTARDVEPRVVRKLVDAHPVAVMLKNKGGLLPLHIAIKAKVPFDVISTLVTANDMAVGEETPAGETPAELAEEHGLSRDTVLYLTNVENDLRANGRLPPQPARYRPLSKSASMRGLGHDYDASAPRASDVDAKMSGLRARGLGRQSSLASASSTAVPHPLPPRWNLDRKCNICQLKFSYFKTRHHCRNCGASVCSTHSSKRLPLRHIGLETPQRVCIMCYDELRENGKPPSAVANLYQSNSKRAPFGDLTNNNKHHARTSMTNSIDATTVESSTVSYQFDGAEFHDSDVEDENIIVKTAPRSRPRAQTEMDSADRITAMRDQVRELEAHMRELRDQKQRVKEAIDAGVEKVSHAVRDKHNQELAVADVRGDSIIDVGRVTTDGELEKKVLGLSSSVDDGVVNAEDLEMPDDATLDIAATCHYLGLAYFEKEDFANAVLEFRKSVSLYRRDADVWYNLARALLATGEPYEAELAVQRALDLRPKNYSAMSLLGKILHERGDHDKSIEIFQTALGLMTTNSDSDDEEDVGSMTVGW